MRIRTIKPEFWQNETIASLSEFTRLLAIALLNYADDHGYFMANHKLIKGNLFPFEDDSKKILRSIQELSCVGYLELGSDSKGRSVARVANFTKHQRVDKPKPSSIKEDFTIQDESQMDHGCILGGMEGNGYGKGSGKEKDHTCPISSDDRETLDFIWKSCHRASRERSSKKDLAEAWKKTKNKPTQEILEKGIAAWMASKKWKDGFAEGIHIWVSKEQWDNLPEPDNGTNRGASHTDFYDEGLTLKDA